jgi:hypothetical protein
MIIPQLFKMTMSFIKQKMQLLKENVIVLVIAFKMFKKLPAKQFFNYNFFRYPLSVCFCNFW